MGAQNERVPAVTIRTIRAGKCLLPLLISMLLLGCNVNLLGPDATSASSPAGESVGGNAPPVSLITGEKPNAAVASSAGDVSDDIVVSVSEESSAGASSGGVNNAGAAIAERQAYRRDFDYPRMATLPLQFIERPNGKKLGVLVTLPADADGNPINQKFPVVLVQTGYNMFLMAATLSGVPGMSLLGAPDKFLVRHGYALVSVDVAGTGVSQGGWELFGEDEQVGYGDAVDWILEQPWSNGNIGTAGISYMGIAALYTAQRRPDAIKAVFAMSPIGDAMRGIVGTGGLINGLFISEWASLTHALSQQNQLAMRKYPQYRDYFQSVTQEHFNQLDAYLLPMVEDALNSEPYLTYDSDYWRTRSTLTRINDIKAPTFITGTLHDIFQRDEPLLYEALKKNVDSRLVIYDGDHITNFLQAFGGGDEVDPALNLYLQWFDKYLKGIDSGVENIPAVTQYVKNYYRLKKSKGLWRGFATTTDWPHPQIGVERWYLHGDMTLDKVAPASDEAAHSVAAPESTGIAWDKSANGKYIVADLDFNDGSDCSISKRQWTLGIAGILEPRSCYYENNTVEEGALNFESAPMPDNYYFNGPIQADIWIDSTATDAVLSVRLDEVSPDGVVKQISNGLLLASNRAVDESRSRFIDGQMIQPFHYLSEDAVMPVVPGEVIMLPVEIFPTSAIILKGHKLRISIAASNQAQGMLNLARQQQIEGSSITVHNSADHPSSIALPVVPMSALN